MTTPRSNIVNDLRADWLVHLAKVVTTLGASFVVLPLALICAVLLAVAAAGPSSGSCVGGMALIIVGAHELKEIVDRPRPPESLVDTTGSSFPSIHAAYSTFYVWLSLTIVLRLRPGMARGAAVIVAGIAVSALVGLSRVYLGAHYLSDVNAGWALGVAAFSLCAAVALVVTHMRHNAAR